MDLPAPQQLPVTAQWCLEDRRCIALEVARTPQQQQIGLMQRPALPPLRGMWFPFDRPRPLSFWMLNTLAPLDMLMFRFVRSCHAPATARRILVMGWWSCGPGRRVAWAFALAIQSRLRRYPLNKQTYLSRFRASQAQNRVHRCQASAIAEGLASPSLQLIELHRQT
jgi:hypothetical protein